MPGALVRQFTVSNKYIYVIDAPLYRFKSSPSNEVKIVKIDNNLYLQDKRS